MNNSPNLFPGLTNGLSEYFRSEGKKFLLQSGTVTEVDNFNPRFFKLLSDEIANDKSASKALDALGLKSQKERVAKFFDCNYSQFDKDPDVGEDGSLGKREYVSCELRGICKHEGKLCKLPLGFTRKEVLVLKYIGMGKLDKEICDILRITPHTLRNHKDNISIKTGTERKPSLGVIAHQVGII